MVWGFASAFGGYLFEGFWLGLDWFGDFGLAVVEE